MTEINTVNKQLARCFSIGRHMCIKGRNVKAIIGQVDAVISDIQKSTNPSLIYGKALTPNNTSNNAIINAITSSIETLTNYMLSAHVANNSLRLDDEKVLTILQSSFIHMSPKMRQSDDEIQVILAEEIKNLDSLEYSLKGLERLAKNCNVNVIFHVEDFQEICIADDGIQIESIFRECVEDAEHTTFVFSGSDDSILTSAFFSDRRRPLYLHLETVELDKL